MGRSLLYYVDQIHNWRTRGKEPALRRENCRLAREKVEITRALKLSSVERIISSFEFTEF